MSRSLVVSETAAFMSDWAAFLDDVTYQDPEVADARGHRSVPLPVGLPSAIVLPEAAFLVRGPSVHRHWRACGVSRAGDELLMTVSASPGVLRARFESGGFSAEETLEAVGPDQLPEPEAVDGRPLFRTSAAVDRTRLRALAWGLNDMLPARDEARYDRWGAEAEHVRLLASALLIPTVLAVHVSGCVPAADDGVVSVETLAHVRPTVPCSRFAVHRRAPDRLAVVADGRTVAAVAIGAGSAEGIHQDLAAAHQAPARTR